jgi:predicted GIY-YIG superfamily endonuclease
MAAWVYILVCADGSYYAGCTTNIDQRYGEHQAGINCAYTSLRRPVVMVWAEEAQDINSAIAVERQIKGWSRAKKEALIRGDYAALPGLSKRGYRPASFETAASRAPQDDEKGGG